MSTHDPNQRAQREPKASSPTGARTKKRAEISGFRESLSGLDAFAWRIDHMGDVAPNPYIRSEHAISVWLSPIVNESVSHLENEAVDINQRRKVLLGVGQLPDVSLGSVWRDGCPATTTGVRARSLRLNLSKTSFVSHGLIPPHVLRFGSLYPHVQSSKLLGVSNASGDAVALIPVIELLRFYFCTESELARLLFWGEWEGAFVRDRTEYVRNGPIDVCLDNHLTLNAAFALSRFILSKEVETQVNRIGATLRSARMRHMQAELECGFPFTDETTLEVIAKEFEFPSPVGRWKRGILIYEIRSCSHSFPFTDCFAHYRIDARKGPEAESLSPIHIPRKPPAVPNLAEPDQGFSSNLGDPTNQVSAHALKTVQTRFKALLGKRVTQRPRTSTQHFRNVPAATKQPEQLLQGLGTGAGRANGVVAPGRIETGTDSNAPLTHQFSLFLKAAAALQESTETLRIVSINAVTLSDRGSASSQESTQTINLLTIASRMRRRGASWAFLSHDPRVGRRMAVLEVALESDQYVYLGDIERRPGSTSESFAVICFANSSFDRLGHECITEIAEAVIQKRGWPRVESRLATSLASYVADTTSHLRITSLTSPDSASAELAQFSRRLHKLILRVRNA